MVLLVAFFIRGFSFFCFAYPTGADYGHHLFYADQYLESGRLPETFPFYQLGSSRWSNLPGGAMIYTVIAALAGRSAFELAAITALFSIIEVAGVYLLAVKNRAAYVGKCQSLSERWSKGYGSIQPRNCFVGGQSTNCKVNATILVAARAQIAVDLWFRVDADRSRTETQIIHELQPPWNGNLWRASDLLRYAET